MNDHISPRLSGRSADAVLAATVTVLAFVALAAEIDEGASARSFVAAAVAGGCVAARRIHPFAALCLTVAARLLVTWEVGNGLAVMPATAVMLYTVARYGDRRVGLLTASAAATVMAFASAAMNGEDVVLELLGEGAQGFLPIALADAVRTRAERVRDLVDAHAEARVQAERLRIARDLHDVVAHGLSTIAVQSGVAAHLLDSDPEQARRALVDINATGKSTLEELRSMVGVLRSTDADALRPTPSDPDDIGEILDGAARAGVNVSAESTGCFPEDVSDATVVAVHRILQEALTNVARHAGAATTTVRVSHHDHHVLLEVTNAQPAGEPCTIASTGVGLVGMRERAESLGGSFHAGTTSDGGFRVDARVPYGRSGT